MEYQSTLMKRSEVSDEITYVIRRMSFGRRLELARKVRELAKVLRFHKAGDGSDQQLDAAIISAEMDRLYLEWGLVAIDGLTVDGVQATSASALDAGPENLMREIIAAIKAECGLSESDRKN